MCCIFVMYVMHQLFLIFDDYAARIIMTINKIMYAQLYYF